MHLLKGCMSLSSQTPVARRRIKAADINGVFDAEYAHDEANFLVEYEGLEDGKGIATRVALLMDNKYKNRYQNILAYDYNRVPVWLWCMQCRADGWQLVAIPHGEGYINASLVRGFTKPGQYIAAQAPPDAVVADFWQMVFEQNVSLIVMITGACVRLLPASSAAQRWWRTDGSRAANTGPASAPPSTTANSRRARFALSIAVMM